MVSTLVYYRPTKLAPYLHLPQSDENEADKSPNASGANISSRADLLPSTIVGGYVTTPTTVTRRASRGSFSTTAGSGFPASPRKVSFGGEADAAAGGIGGGTATAVGSFQRRVGSLGNLLLTPTRHGNSSAAASPGIIGSSSGAGAFSNSLPAHQGSHRARINALYASSRQQRYNYRYLPGQPSLSTPFSIPPIIVDDSLALTPDWRLRDRMKTVAVGLILAVNVGTDPPDIIKPHPCAVLQCWIDPSKYSRVKAKELIGERLEAQYAKWQLARKTGPGGLKYRRALDPTVEDVRNLCLRLRNQARTERVLLHYNGYGVPRPSDHGEIWVFDKNHTEYIPLPVADLKLWIGKPAIVVLDCSSAGLLVPHFTAQANDDTSTGGNSSSSINSNNHSPSTVPVVLFPGTNGPPTTRSSPSTPPLTLPTTNEMDEQASQWVRDTIVLCPCSENEWLPMHPDYPADIFTSCLTTPIPMALRWFINRNPASMSGLSPETVDAIPGASNDRKTPLGELNWIFTTVTDSIAWNILPKPLFARLFRQDLLVASMFRNFLLADRILRSMGCTPVSFPPLPPGAADHPLWQAWDLACETLLFQLMQDGILGNHLLAPEKKKRNRTNMDGTDDNAIADVSSSSSDDAAAAAAHLQQRAQPVAVASSISSPFFSEQLAAFEVWLEFAEIHKIRLAAGGPSALDPPEHLPVVLQVLLSQVHRIRALTLLRRFLVLGPWAVNLSLRLGIFPYVMKLLQSPEYKSLLVCIWASILAFDPSCRVDILKDGALHHFVQHLMWGLINSSTVVAEESAKERTLAAFILSVACHEFPAGQAECVRLNLLGSCVTLLSSYEQGERAQDSATESQFAPRFRLWLCVCLGNIVKDNASIQTEAYAADIHQRLAVRMHDKNADVRAAVCYAVSCLIQENNQSNRVASSHDLASQLNQQGYMGLQPTPGSLAQPRLTAVPGLSGTGQAVPSLVGPARATFSPVGLPSNVQLIPQQSSLQGNQQMSLLQNQPITVQPGALWNQPQAFHPDQAQQQSLAGLPLERNPIAGSRAHPSFSSLPTFQQSPNFTTVRPSVFEDRHRLELDFTSLNIILQAVRDGSVVVRYEATIALGVVVEKYLDAFVSIAEEFTIAKASHVEGETPKVSQPLPYRLHRDDLARFRPAWMWLRSLQREDPFPPISKAANTIVSVVHELLLRCTTESERAASSGTNATLLSGIDEDHVPPSGMYSSPPFELRLESGHKFVKSDLRRVSSEASYAKGKMVSMDGAADSNTFPRVSSTAKPGEASSYSFPKSQFYDFKKDTFDPNFLANDDSESQELDPLSPTGATQQYQYRRNYLSREHGEMLVKRYACLAPKPPVPAKKSIQMILDEEEIDGPALLAAEEYAASRKLELEFKEDVLCRNDGVKTTSLVKFHPYENYLMACGDSGLVSMWDTQSGKRRALFSNGNPKGSRMTTSFWINAESASASHFMVGCDDGTVRVWGGLLESDGQSASSPPRLLSAFHASAMESDPWGSGLVAEWQNYSGTLFAGGNSKAIRCWDLEAEKVVTKLGTNTGAYVTTLTTAWDEDNGPRTASHGSHGIGKDVIVAGLSDGSLKVFDIRSNSHQGETTLSEHKSWVVTTAFQCYPGRYELISATLSGEIKAWDLRMPTSIRTLDVQRSTMTALAVHSKIPIAATGSDSQFIKVVALDGDTMQLLRYHEKLASHRIGPVSCLSFHPYLPLLAAGATDCYIGIYTTRQHAQQKTR